MSLNRSASDFFSDRSYDSGYGFLARRFGAELDDGRTDGWMDRSFSLKARGLGFGLAVATIEHLSCIPPLLVSSGDFSTSSKCDLGIWGLRFVSSYVTYNHVHVGKNWRNPHTNNHQTWPPPTLSEELENSVFG